MARISVIMPTYNCAEYLGESIRSVFDQSYQDLELIVVDGASEDNIDGVIKEYEKDKRLVYQKMPKCSIAAARNRGIKMARGELIAFLDGDDLFLRDKLSKQVNFFEKNKCFDICYTNSIYFNSDTGKEEPCTYYHFSGDIFCYIKRNNFIHPSAVMARKKIFDKDLFNEKIPPHEDWEFFLRLAYKGVNFAYMREPLSKIRVREKSITKNVEIMNLARRVVGLMARDYWKKFKKERSFTSLKGLKAVFRYLKFKIEIFLTGFPKKARFNRPLARDLVCGAGDKKNVKK